MQAGLVAQSMPCTPRPDDNKSPKMAGPDAFAGKKAKNLGDCQWVTPGKTIESMSRTSWSNDSPWTGGAAGNRSPDFSWGDSRKHRKGLNALVVVSDPVDDLPSVLPELTWGHVIASIFGHGHLLEIAGYHKTKVVPAGLQPIQPWALRPQLTIN